MNGTVVISYDFQKTLRPGLCSGAAPTSLHVVRGATWYLHGFVKLTAVNYLFG